MSYYVQGPSRKCVLRLVGDDAIHNLLEGLNVVGSSSDAEVILADTRSLHALIEASSDRGGSYFISIWEPHCRPAVFVNQINVSSAKRVEGRAGDVIRIGPNSFDVEAVPPNFNPPSQHTHRVRDDFLGQAINDLDRSESSSPNLLGPVDAVDRASQILVNDSMMFDREMITANDSSVLATSRDSSHINVSKVLDSQPVGPSSHQVPPRTPFLSTSTRSGSPQVLYSEETEAQSDDDENLDREKFRQEFEAEASCLSPGDVGFDEKENEPAPLPEVGMKLVSAKLVGPEGSEPPDGPGMEMDDRLQDEKFRLEFEAEAGLDANAPTPEPTQEVTAAPVVIRPPDTAQIPAFDALVGMRLMSVKRNVPPAPRAESAGAAAAASEAASGRARVTSGGGPPANGNPVIHRETAPRNVPSGIVWPRTEASDHHDFQLQASRQGYDTVLSPLRGGPGAITDQHLKQILGSGSSGSSSDPVNLFNQSTPPIDPAEVEQAQRITERRLLHARMLGQPSGVAPVGDPKNRVTESPSLEPTPPSPVGGGWLNMGATQPYLETPTKQDSRKTTLQSSYFTSPARGTDGGSFNLDRYLAEKEVPTLHMRFRGTKVGEPRKDHMGEVLSAVESQSDKSEKSAKSNSEKSQGPLSKSEKSDEKSSAMSKSEKSEISESKKPGETSNKPNLAKSLATSRKSKRLAAKADATIAEAQSEQAEDVKEPQGTSAVPSAGFANLDVNSYVALTVFPEKDRPRPARNVAQGGDRIENGGAQTQEQGIQTEDVGEFSKYTKLASREELGNPPQETEIGAAETKVDKGKEIVSRGTIARFPIRAEDGLKSILRRPTRISPPPPSLDDNNLPGCSDGMPPSGGPIPGSLSEPRSILKNRDRLVPPEQGSFSSDDNDNSVSPDMHAAATEVLAAAGTSAGTGNMSSRKRKFSEILKQKPMEEGDEVEGVDFDNMDVGEAKQKQSEADPEELKLASSKSKSLEKEVSLVDSLSLVRRSARPHSGDAATAPKPKTTKKQRSKAGPRTKERSQTPSKPRSRAKTRSRSGTPSKTRTQAKTRAGSRAKPRSRAKSRSRSRTPSKTRSKAKTRVGSRAKPRSRAKTRSRSGSSSTSSKAKTPSRSRAKTISRGKTRSRAKTQSNPRNSGTKPGGRGKKDAVASGSSTVPTKQVAASVTLVPAKVIRGSNTSQPASLPKKPVVGASKKPTSTSRSVSAATKAPSDGGREKERIFLPAATERHMEEQAASSERSEPERIQRAESPATARSHSPAPSDERTVTPVTVITTLPSALPGPGMSAIVEQKPSVSTGTGKRIMTSPPPLAKQSIIDRGDRSRSLSPTASSRSKSPPQRAVEVQGRKRASTSQPVTKPKSVKSKKSALRPKKAKSVSPRPSSPGRSSSSSSSARPPSPVAPKRPTAPARGKRAPKRRPPKRAGKGVTFSPKDVKRMNANDNRPKTVGGQRIRDRKVTPATVPPSGGRKRRVFSSEEEEGSDEENGEDTYSDASELGSARADKSSLSSSEGSNPGRARSTRAKPTNTAGMRRSTNVKRKKSGADTVLTDRSTGANLDQSGTTYPECMGLAPAHGSSDAVPVESSPDVSQRNDKTPLASGRRNAAQSLRSKDKDSFSEVPTRTGSPAGRNSPSSTRSQVGRKELRKLRVESEKSTDESRNITSRVPMREPQKSTSKLQNLTTERSRSEPQKLKKNECVGVEKSQSESGKLESTGERKKSTDAQKPRRSRNESQNCRKSKPGSLSKSNLSTLREIDTSDSAAGDRMTSDNEGMIKVCFTGQPPGKGQVGLEQIWQTSNPSICDVLVADKFRRTRKFLIAVARGVPIVSPEWIKAVQNGNLSALDAPSSYLLREAEAENKLRFDLATTLAQAAAKPLLQGWTVLVAPHVVPPQHEMCDIVAAAGATPITIKKRFDIESALNDVANRHRTVPPPDCGLTGETVPRLSAANSTAPSFESTNSTAPGFDSTNSTAPGIDPTTICICGADDALLASTAVAAGIKAVTAELVLTGLLRYEADVHRFAFPVKARDSLKKRK